MSKISSDHNSFFCFLWAGGQIENISKTGKRRDKSDDFDNVDTKRLKIEVDADTRKYHDIGDKLLVKYYSKFITEGEKKKLDVWLGKKQKEGYKIGTDKEIQKVINELFKTLPKAKEGPQSHCSGNAV